MSSIVCPVCKRFEAFTNNTLNTHMDQCLIKKEGASSDHLLVSKPETRLGRFRNLRKVYMASPHYTMDEVEKLSKETQDPETTKRIKSLIKPPQSENQKQGQNRPVAGRKVHRSRATTSEVQMHQELENKSNGSNKRLTKPASSMKTIPSEKISGYDGPVADSPISGISSNSISAAIFKNSALQKTERVSKAFFSNPKAPQVLEGHVTSSKAKSHACKGRCMAMDLDLDADKKTSKATETYHFTASRKVQNVTCGLKRTHEFGSPKIGAQEPRLSLSLGSRSRPSNVSMTSLLHNSYSGMNYNNTHQPAPNNYSSHVNPNPQHQPTQSFPASRYSSFAPYNSRAVGHDHNPMNSVHTFAASGPSSYAPSDTQPVRNHSAQSSFFPILPRPGPIGPTSYAPSSSQPPFFWITPSRQL